MDLSSRSGAPENGMSVVWEGLARAKGMQCLKMSASRAAWFMYLNVQALTEVTYRNGKLV